MYYFLIYLVIPLHVATAAFNILNVFYCHDGLWNKLHQWGNIVCVGVHNVLYKALLNFRALASHSSYIAENDDVNPLRQGCQTQFPGGRSVCRFLWFPFNQLSIKACIPRCVYSLANQLLEWTKGAENNPKTSRHSGPPGLEFDTCALRAGPVRIFFAFIPFFTLQFSVTTVTGYTYTT